MTPIPIAIRAPIENDQAFIISSFLHSWRGYGDNALMKNETYFARLKPLAERIAHGAVVLAVNPEDEWQMFGWIAFAPGRMHYAYTKSAYRRMGVFTRLHEAAGSPSVATRVGRLWPELRDKFLLTYDPGAQ